MSSKPTVSETFSRAFSVNSYNTENDDGVDRVEDADWDRRSAFLMQGTLKKKQRTSFSLWQTRYVVLQQKFLWSFKDVKELDECKAPNSTSCPRKGYRLNLVRDVTVKDQVLSVHFLGDTRVLSLEAKSSEEAVQWQRAINNAKSQEQPILEANDAADEGSAADFYKPYYLRRSPFASLLSKTELISLANYLFSKLTRKVRLCKRGLIPSRMYQNPIYLDLH